jgi:hypothetical protein
MLSTVVHTSWNLMPAYIAGSESFLGKQRTAALDPRTST